MAERVKHIATSNGLTGSRAALVSAILGSTMVFVDGTVVNVALPVLQQTLGASVAQAQWIVEAYMLFLAALLLVGGALGDRWGRRYTFVLGTVLFAAASAWCGMSTSVRALIVARGAQGIGAALLVPGSLALISTSYDRSSRGRAIGTWAAFTSIAAGIGPIIGGWLVEAISWRWIFFLNLPLAALVVLIVRHVPESRGEAEEGHIDVAGATLATLGLFAIVFGLIDAGTPDFSAARVVATIGGGVTALIAFALTEARISKPMLKPSLFRSRTFAGANLLTLFLYCGMSATMFVLPFNLIRRQGYSVVEAGAAFLPFVTVMFLLSRWAGGLMDKYGSRLPLTIGPLIVVSGFLLFTRSTAGSYWASVFPAILVMSVGMAVSVAPLTATVMTSVDEGHAGLASGINNAVSRLASLLAVAIAGVVVHGPLETGMNRIALMSAGLAVAGAICAFLLIESPTRGPRDQGGREKIGS
jgi:EmrB/QacA subfamily drug resistance transporter